MTLLLYKASWLGPQVYSGSFEVPEPGPVRHEVQAQLPIRLVSEANLREHWRARDKRASDQRGTTLRCLSSIPFVTPKPPLVVTIVRVAPRKLDDDNLAISGKHVRDGIADYLGVDDGDPRITWRYEQAQGEPGQYATRIQIEEVR